MATWAVHLRFVLNIQHNAVKFGVNRKNKIFLHVLKLNNNLLWSQRYYSSFVTAQVSKNRKAVKVCSCWPLRGQRHEICHTYFYPQSLFCKERQERIDPVDLLKRAKSDGSYSFGIKRDRIAHSRSFKDRQDRKSEVQKIERANSQPWLIVNV